MLDPRGSGEHKYGHAEEQIVATKIRYMAGNGEQSEAESARELDGAERRQGSLRCEIGKSDTALRLLPWDTSLRVGCDERHPYCSCSRL
jgi:hypothetical protein